MVHRQPLLVPYRHFGRESLGLGRSGQVGDVLLGPETLRDPHRLLRVAIVQKQLVPGFRKLLSQSETKTVRRSGDQNRRHGAAFSCGDPGPAPGRAPARS
ncbi:hypothetical protein GCM10010358_78470 [Streptomyces minutiscleroticus]|uniref:Uncharacterized protein n=1 Tax=Streptomyces minutiscleroticus TaxID=68238 RepID=A0A918P215_9ACTN|nr:hypothetical protein [Streptomyces minutiscleroticus]GGY14731.1 hypothetical protein GCM10010358_78470 [Streptomyces minutiscleroticus]